jgi:flagellar biosynthetic protein FliO
LGICFFLCLSLGGGAAAQSEQPAAESSPEKSQIGPVADQAPDSVLSTANQNIPGEATAEPAPPLKTQPVEEATDWGEMVYPFIRTVGGVGLVLCLIVAATMVFRRFAPQYFPKRPVERTLRLIENLSMGEKRSVALVEVGGQQYLVGNTPHQISLLAVLESAGQASASDGVEPGSARPSPKKSGFLKLYRAEQRKPSRKPSGESILPADIRGKMQELRQALER